MDAKVSSKSIVLSAFIGAVATIAVGMFTSAADLLKLPLTTQQIRQYELDNTLKSLEVKERQADYIAKLIPNVSVSSSEINHVINEGHHFIKRGITLKNMGYYPVDLKFLRFDITDDLGKPFEYSDFQGITHKPLLHSSTFSLDGETSLPKGIEIHEQVAIEVKQLPCGVVKYIRLNIELEISTNKSVLNQLVPEDNSFTTTIFFSTPYKWWRNKC